MKQRKLRRRQCDGKMRHPSQEAAVIAAQRMSKKMRCLITAYWCKFCGHYHCGHAPFNVRQSIRNRQARREEKNEPRVTSWPSFANVELAERIRERRG